jgi:DNA repair exonuclease SbcCD ATPase subunit
MKIKLKRLRLLNFKGITKLDIPFNPDHETNISGDNATGKTTIFDAFLWLMFGKDSFDRKDFNIKTLDAFNKAIERLPHEVEGIIDVDGKEITLKRTFSEIWQKKRGSAIEEFTKHETGYFFDDISCSQGEFQTKVGELCAEQLFKLITNPAYFPSQKKEVQRQILIQIAGSITDEEIAYSRRDFKALLEEITGITLDEYRRKISAKKKLIKDQLSGIPDRIDEVKNNIPQVQDWVAIENMIKSNETEIENIDGKLLDISKQFADHNSKQVEFLKQVNNLRMSRSGKIEEIVKQKSADRTLLLKEFNYLKDTLSENKSELQRKQRNLETLIQEKNRIESEITTLRSNWQSEFAKNIEFNDNEFHCPTCKRAFEESDVDQRKASLTANFNTEKERKLNEITQKGSSLKTKLENIQASITRDQSSIGTLNESISEIQAKYDAAEHNIPEAEDHTTEALNFTEILKIDQEIASLQIRIDTPFEVQSDISMNERKSLLNAQNKELSAKLALKEVIENSEARILFLETEQRTLSQELADYEKREFVVMEFSKAKITEVEKRINSMFQLVKFKMFETQINGGEVETCEAMVNGVPFSDLNNAMRINAGLDIIGALSRHHNITAPIFIDNAESINEIIVTDSQLIRLIVTHDKQLKF